LPKPRLSVSTRNIGRPSRKGKYNAKGEHVDGHWFASAAEARRYEQLRIMLHDERICRLELQPVFEIRINNHLITRYRGDFRYGVLDERGVLADVVIEDVKGMLTDVYVMKKKLVEALHSVRINEIPARKVGEWAGRVP
jgi:hypothetical protein